MLFLDRNNNGFTLLEIMFAVLIVGIALVGIALAFSRSSIFITEIRQTSVATQAAQEEIEIIRDMDFDNILALGSSFTAAGFSSLNNPIGTLTVDNPYGTADMRRVTVTVTWTSPEGRTLSRSLVTLVTRDGINRQ
jgi:prepilin-type N-terminal cleavage/methylation domain-containing protein